ncbi:MAG: hypothetical protein ACRD5H_04950 [Nitrososphaerales archaeon]
MQITSGSEECCLKSFKEQTGLTENGRFFANVQYDKGRYARIAVISKEPRVVVYANLERDIEDIVRKSDGKCIFDVSGLLKGYLIDVCTLLLSRKIEEIYAFELKLKNRSYDETELIHNLDAEDYSFTNLAKSNYTSGRVVVTKKQEELVKQQQGVIEKLIEMIATSYATHRITYWTLFLSTIAVSAVIYITWADWDKIEKWTFIVFGLPFPYIVALIIQIMFKRQFSLKPEWLSDWLKNRKLRKLEQEFGVEVVGAAIAKARSSINRSR